MQKFERLLIALKWINNIFLMRRHNFACPGIFLSRAHFSIRGRRNFFIQFPPSRRQKKLQLIGRELKNLLFVLVLPLIDLFFFRWLAPPSCANSEIPEILHTFEPIFTKLFLDFRVKYFLNNRCNSKLQFQTARWCHIRTLDKHWQNY